MAALVSKDEETREPGIKCDSKNVWFLYKSFHKKCVTFDQIWQIKII